MDMDEAIKQGKWHVSDYISPHEYIVYERDLEAFRLIRKEIEEHGVMEKFQGRSYKYWYYEGWKYWAIFPVINRARIKPAAAA